MESAETFLLHTSVSGELVGVGGERENWIHRSPRPIKKSLYITTKNLSTKHIHHLIFTLSLLGS